jgi:hypothetical protein
MGYRRWGTNPYYALVDRAWVGGHYYVKPLEAWQPSPGGSTGDGPTGGDAR